MNMLNDLRFTKICLILSLSVCAFLSYWCFHQEKKILVLAGIGKDEPNFEVYKNGFNDGIEFLLIDFPIEFKLSVLDEEKNKLDDYIENKFNWRYKK